MVIVAGLAATLSSCIERPPERYALLFIAQVRDGEARAYEATGHYADLPELRKYLTRDLIDLKQTVGLDSKLTVSQANYEVTVSGRRCFIRANKNGVVEKRTADDAGGDARHW